MNKIKSDLSQWVVQNRFGFYELKKKPTPEELRRYYADKYYQAPASSTYHSSYSSDELAYIQNKVDQKLRMIQSIRGDKPGTLLDVGAGEGWAVSHFAKNGWTCRALDFSEAGFKTHNPQHLPLLKCGDVFESLADLASEGASFDVIWMDNVLEHVLDPLELLKLVRGIGHKDTIYLIEVPNDFSPVQLAAWEKGLINNPFWIVDPDHISYFSREGLIALCREAGLQEKATLSDFPIDWSLFNSETNYVQNKQKGKACHNARVTIENLLHSVSPDDTNQLYLALAKLGVGRVLSGFFTAAK